MLKKALVFAGAVVLLTLLYATWTSFDAAGQASAGQEIIVLQPLVLAPPVQRDAEFNRIKARNPWFFPGWSKTAVTLFLEEAFLTEPLRTGLLGKIQEYPPVNGCVIMPSDEEVLALPADARKWIYNHLSRFNMNKDQAAAGRYSSRSMTEWMGETPIAESTRQWMEALAYRNGSLLFFADLPLLLELIDDPLERKRVYTALRSVETLRLSMRIPEHADLDRLTEYWGAGGYQNQVRPILAKAQAEGIALDLARLLPPVPRELLYKFPIEADMNTGSENCHWTTANFFSSPEQAVPCDAESVQDFIMNECIRIQQEQLQYGDIVVYLRDAPAGFEVVHSAVYIVDDIVFTKNGVTWFSPWMYMQLHHMDDYYHYGAALRKIYIRRRSGNGAARGFPAPAVPAG